MLTLCGWLIGFSPACPCFPNGWVSAERQNYFPGTNYKRPFPKCLYWIWFPRPEEMKSPWLLQFWDQAHKPPEASAWHLPSTSSDHQQSFWNLTLVIITLLRAHNEAHLSSVASYLVWPWVHAIAWESLLQSHSNSIFLIAVVPMVPQKCQGGLT